jgi:hypothetical protein
VILIFSCASALALTVAGCEKDKLPPAGLPPLGGVDRPDTPAKTPTGTTTLPPHAVHAPTGESQNEVEMPHGHPPLPPGHPSTESETGPFAGKTMPGPGPDFDPAARLVASVDVDPALKDKVAAGDVIFVTARQDDGSDKGSILGVKRLVAGKWPMALEVDGRDAMNPGTKFAGKVLLTVRVDKDGDAMSKNPGDLVGVAHVTVPDTKIKLTIDKLLTQATAPPTP